MAQSFTQFIFRRFCATFFLTLLFVAIGNANPAISSFTPGFGSSSDPGFITINGSGFYPGTLVVKFNGVQDTNAGATAADGTVIQAHVPAGAPLGSNPIFVSVNGVSTLSADNFTVIGAGPYITGFSPATGSAGTVVTISGTHFTGANFVRFNGVSAAGDVLSDSLIQATAPGGVTTGPISVERTSVGTNTTVTNFFVPPSITSLSTNAGIVGSSLVITGKNFLGASAVRFFNNVSAPFTVNSNTQISTTVPTNALSGPISIVAPAGSTSPTNYVVRPSLLGFTPGVGTVGALVTINGYSLLGVTSVAFNGATAVITATNYSQLTATVPGGATTGKITVTTTNGSAMSTTNFFLPPSISSFTPSNSAPNTTITISGQNFLGASAVAFNGTAASFIPPTNNTTIYATVPNGVTTGPVSVTAPAGTAASSDLFYAAPIIMEFNPSHGLPGTNVTITGQNFLGTTQVQFNGVNAAITSVSSNQIVVTAPTAETGPINLTAPAGAATTTTDFVFDYRSNLKLTISDTPDPVFVGSNLVYSLIVSNGGPQNAPVVVITNTLPTNIVFKAASTDHGSLITNNNQIIGNIGSLNFGNTATMTITVAPQAPGTITNTASARSGYADPDLSDNDPGITTTVLPFPVLTIERASPTQVRISWPVVLTNFALEFNDSFTNTGWTNDLTAPDISGDQKTVTETNSGSGKFFRLKQ